MALSYGQIKFVLIFCLGGACSSPRSSAMKVYRAFYGAPGIMVRFHIRYAVILLYWRCNHLIPHPFPEVEISSDWDWVLLELYGNLPNNIVIPIKWNFTVQPIVGTLGNPDFVSALLGMARSRLSGGYWKIAVLAPSLDCCTLILFEVYIIRLMWLNAGLMIVAVGFAILVVAKYLELEEVGGVHFGLLWHRNWDLYPYFLGY
jgi:hypothetical protein